MLTAEKSLFSIRLILRQFCLPLHRVTGYIFNPFRANVLILYPLKAPENERFSGVFKGYKIGTLVTNGINHFVPILTFISVLSSTLQQPLLNTGKS